MSTGIQRGQPEKRRRSQAIKAQPREIQLGIPPSATIPQLGPDRCSVEVQRPWLRLRSWQWWVFGTGMLCLVGLTPVFWAWWMVPERRVPRLLRELRDVPGGKFEFSLSRHGKTIHADLDALGLTAVPALTEAINHLCDSMTAWHAARQLAKLGDLRAVDPLIQYLQKNPTDINVWIVDALGDLKDPRAIDPLVAALKEKADYHAIARSLCKIEGGRKQAFEPVLAMLGDGDARIRVRAVYVLGSLRQPGTLNAIVGALENDKDPKVRAAAAEALRYLDDRRAIPALDRASADPSPDVRQAVKSAIFELTRRKGAMYQEPDPVNP